MEYRIGRADDNDLVIENKTVSNHHAIITRQGYDFFIEDLNSVNGTKINGKRIKPKTSTRFSTDDKIEVGKHMLTSVEKLDIFEPDDKTLVVTDLQTSPLLEDEEETATTQRIQSRMMLLVAGSVAVLLLVIAVLLFKVSTKIDSTVEKMAPEIGSPASQTEVIKKDAVVLIHHRYIGEKGGMYLCANSVGLQQAAEEAGFSVSPELTYAIIPDRTLAEQHAFNVWGSGVCVSADGHILTHSFVGNPTFSLENYSLESGIFFDGVTVSMNLWFNGMKRNKTPMDAQLIDSLSLELNELAILQLTTSPPNLPFIPVNKIGLAESIGIGDAITFVGFSSPDQAQAIIQTTSVAGVVQRIEDNQIEYNFIVSGTAAVGAPLFNAQGKMVALHIGSVGEQNNLSFGINEFATITQLLELGK